MYKPVKSSLDLMLSVELAFLASSVPPLLGGTASLPPFGWLLVSQLLSSHITGNFIPASGALGGRLEKRERQPVRVRRGAL